MDSIRIDPRFRGPVDSGNGGYVAGLVAGLLDEPCVVELRSPPPLAVDLAVRPTDAGGVEVLDGDTLVAAARPAALPDLEPPDVPDLAEAAAAVPRFIGFVHHPFPECFVCGPERDEGDGLRIFPGMVEGADVAAAPWTPDQILAGPDGDVAPEFVWSALDCPSYFGAADGRTAVLASLRIHQHAPVPVGQPLVALGWGQGTEGRKIRGASALATGEGQVLAVADALWIELRM